MNLVTRASEGALGSETVSALWSLPLHVHRCGVGRRSRAELVVSQEPRHLVPAFLLRIWRSRLNP